MSLVNLHTHTFSNENSVLEVVNQYPWQFDESVAMYSIGIHPWYIDEDRLNIDLKCIDEKLKLIYQESFPNIKVFTPSEKWSKESFDCHLPIGSLGKFFRNN